MMDRRKFLGSLIGGLAASAAVRTFPFRVFSFPKEIELPEYGTIFPALFNPEPVWVGIWVSGINGPYRFI
jgi:hypothetical protein